MSAIVAGVIVNLADGPTVELDAFLGFQYRLVATGNRTINVPTHAVDGQKIVITHKALGAPRTLSLNTGVGGFRFGTKVPALAITPEGKTDYIGCFYNGAEQYWDVASYMTGY